MRPLKLYSVLAILALVTLPATAALITPSDARWDPVVWDASGNGHADDEWNLYDIYNGLYGTRFTANSDLDPLQIDDAPGLFLTDLLPPDGTVTVTARVRFAWLVHNFGWYEAGPTGDPILHLLFPEIDEIGFLGDTYSADVSPTGLFGAHNYTHEPGNTGLGYDWYSESSRNFEPGEDHMLVYHTPDPNTYLVAWEDMPWNNEYGDDSDRDYNDLVLEVRVDPIIPEPASVLLLGLGIVGVVVGRLRKSS